MGRQAKLCPLVSTMSGRSSAAGMRKSIHAAAGPTMVVEGVAGVASGVGAGILLCFATEMGRCSAKKGATAAAVRMVRARRADAVDATAAVPVDLSCDAILRFFSPRLLKDWCNNLKIFGAQNIFDKLNSIADCLREGELSYLRLTFLYSSNLALFQNNKKVMFLAAKRLD